MEMYHKEGEPPLTNELEVTSTDRGDVTIIQRMPPQGDQVVGIRVDHMEELIVNYIAEFGLHIPKTNGVNIIQDEDGTIIQAWK